MMSNSNLSEYKQCTKCVMDTVGNIEIKFDNSGVCNYCYEYQSK